MKRTLLTFAAVYAVVIGATSCGGGNAGPTVPPGGGSGGGTTTASYQQIERLGRPAIKEAFQQFNNHDNTNRTSPYATPLTSQSLYQEIGSFSAAVGRSTAVQQTLQAVLIPDALVADLSQTGNTLYLGVELHGANPTGVPANFGGRALSDDVIDTDLGALFGNALQTLANVPEDNAEIPCMTTDNVGYNAAAKKQTPGVYPYVGLPN